MSIKLVGIQPVKYADYGTSEVPAGPVHPRYEDSFWWPSGAARTGWVLGYGVAVVLSLVTLVLLAGWRTTYGRELKRAREEG